MSTITIRKDLDLFFLGRNGSGRMCGVVIDSYGDVVDIRPITSKGATGRCSIMIPVSQVDEFIAALQNEVRSSTPPGDDLGEETVNALVFRFGAWGEHPGYPRSDWRYLVANGDTQRGYWEHVQACLEQAREETR